MTWPGSARPLVAACVAFLLAIALLGAVDSASAAVTASVGSNQLLVTSDAAGDQITLRLSANGAAIEVRQGATLVGSFPRASFVAIRIDAGDGNDTVTIDESAGVFTDTESTIIEGGAGADSITGGSGGETIWGGQGNDILRGGAGDDRFVWEGGVGFITPSDGSDTVDGQDGIDTLDARGTTAAEVYALLANGARATLTRSGGAISIDVGTTERLEMRLLAGDDEFMASPGLQAPTVILVDGGDGNDAITGGSHGDILLGNTGDDTIVGGGGDDLIQGDAGVDSLDGGAGNDQLLGGPGDDLITGGAGDDRLRWGTNDGSDVVEGADGTDTIIVDGSSGDDVYNVGRNAIDHTRVYILRNQAPLISQDGGSIERVEVFTGAGADRVGMGPFSDTVLQQIEVDLGSGNDELISQYSAAPVVATGGVGDFDALTFCACNVPAGWAPPTISVNGVVKMTYAEFESIELTTVIGTMPTIDITTPTPAPSMTASTPFLTLAGLAADAEGIQQVTWSNDRGGSGVASGTTTWTAANVPLQPGANAIAVTVVDTDDNSSTKTLVVQLTGITYSLAEGATGSFFDLDVLIANPTTTPAPVTVTFLREGGTPVTQSMTLAPTSRATLQVDAIAGLENQGGISTVVTSTNAVPLVVERTMFWDASHYGSHGGTAVDGPGTRWLFAEGSEGFFNTFVLLANAGLSPSNVTLTFLREGSTPFVKTLTVPGSSRVTVAANGIPELVGRSFSIVVDASAPIIAERAMYFGTAHLLDGGHESAGVPAGATSWFLAEGATGSYFTTFVLIGNPNPVAANVTLTYLTTSGQTLVRNKVVPANGRLTVNVALEDPILASAAVSTTVSADQPVIAERAMYWPGAPSTWAEAHNSFGATTLATKWGLAEGRVGMAHAFQTYILLANPSATAASVQITFLRASGPPVVKTFTVAPTSRFNVAVNTAAPELQNEMFGALIEVTNGVGISVERAMYSDALGQIWAAGTNALATRLP